MSPQPPAPNGTCRDADCGDRIIWAVTANGKSMPVDPDPVADGNVLLTDVGLPSPQATVVNPAAEPLGGWPGTLHKAHFATCPGAANWRTVRGR